MTGQDIIGGKGYVKAISDWSEGGAKTFFIKKFRGVSSLIAMYMGKAVK